MFGSMGITELVLILFIVLIIFGAGKLPQLGEGLGKAIKGFKKSVHEADAIELEASKQDAQTQPGAMPGSSSTTAAPPPPGQVASEPPKA
jgi:sec-independent protein translocase protein TatA